MNLLLLSDEILIIIIEYLNGKDKMRLSRTCRKFQELMSERKLARSWNFSGCFSMSIYETRRFLTRTIPREHVKVLNLTSCYWLLSSEILNLVTKFPNLEAVYAADTQLLWAHVIQILKVLHKVMRLSWSWHCVATAEQANRMCKEVWSVAHSIKQLKFLFLHLKTEQMTMHCTSVLCTFLLPCQNLEELWVLAPAQASELPYSLGLQRYDVDLELPHLHTLVLSLSDHSRSSLSMQAFYSIILQACGMRDSWKICWVSNSRLGCLVNTLPRAKALMVTRGKTDSIPQDLRQVKHLGIVDRRLVHGIEYPTPYLKKLYLNQVAGLENWNTLWESVSGLEEVNISMCVWNIKNIKVQPQMTKLSLPVCIFKDAGPQLDSAAANSNRIIRVIVETCPNLQVFELVPCTGCSYRPNQAAQEASLLWISKWKNLRRLKLEGLDCIYSGKPLMQIFKMCEKLESISLKNLGMNGKCNYSHFLYQALPFCKNLKEFRLEQANVLNQEHLFKRLAECCPQLERLCMITARHGDLSNPTVLVNLALVCKHLVFLFVAMDSLTQSACKFAHGAIRKRLRVSRPALHVTVVGRSILDSENARRVPGIHYFEMVEDVSRVSIMPGNGPHYLSHCDECTSKI